MILLIDLCSPYREAFHAWAERARLDVIERTDTDLAPNAPLGLCVLQAGSDRDVRDERLDRLAKLCNGSPVVVLAHHVSTDGVVQALHRGVTDVLGLPADPADVVARATRHLAHVAATGAALIGWSPAMRSISRELATLARGEASVLLTGETGVGKGLAARLLHDLSDRSAEPFVHVDCGALASTLAESELFGHERGAFTGANERRIGRFELAGRGTVFLDEVGELERGLQAKLLRILQDRAFERVGGHKTLRMVARVVSATNRNLREQARTGLYRRDLFFRLAVFELRLPPLRERPEDIPALTRHGLELLSGRLGVRLPRADASFYGALARHDWPGNVRELFNLIERVLVRSTGATLDATQVEREIPEAWTRRDSALPVLLSPEDRELATALERAGGNVSRAARRLGIPRSTLRYRIDRAGLKMLVPDD